MHIYNAWLPPPVAEEARKEAGRFAAAVRSVRDAWRPDDGESVYSTLKWINILDLFISAKSDLSPGDLQELVELGLQLFRASNFKLFAQVRWGRLLVKLLKKHKKQLSLQIEWRPLYDTLVRTHFKRNTGPEGWKLRQQHFETVTSLIQLCRKFFPPGSASEIWLEFRALMENPWHNSVFDGAGFANLFLPTNQNNKDFYTQKWIAESLELWDSIPNCTFWDIQWSSLVANCIKNCKSIEWEGFLPSLFSHYLNMFQVPVSNGSGSYPFLLDVPGGTRFLFSSKNRTPSKAIAKSIVHLLGPNGKVQDHFEKLLNLLEQFYHPSNGGHWTHSLERFLRYLIIYFQKRLQSEYSMARDGKGNEMCLGKEERASFVKVVLKLVDRGQYSKDSSLSETVSIATSVLSYVEPSLVLPFVVTKFQMASETMTATHQLKTAIASVAYAGRALLLAAPSNTYQDEDCVSDVYLDLIRASLSNALLGIDANDPPKTLATMQLIGSIFSSLFVVGFEDNVGPIFLQNIHLSEWLDEFLSQLFALLQHLEPSSNISEGGPTSTLSGTFLIQETPHYYCMLQILLGKLSKPLFTQSLKKIAKFVTTNILCGATSDIGHLCCVCVCSSPDEAVEQLIKPLLQKIFSYLEGTPVASFVGRGLADASSSAKAELSPALETALVYYYGLLAVSTSYAGPALLNCKDELKEALKSAYQAPSSKVNFAGGNVLRSLLVSLVSYYPINQYETSHQLEKSIMEQWVCPKAYQNDEEEFLEFRPRWHVSSKDELAFAQELLELHFESALADLLMICNKTNMHTPGELGEKEHLKMILLRIYSVLQGVMSCLPELRPTCKNGAQNELDEIIPHIAGASGSTVGSSKMRENAAQIIHIACRYFLKERTDDSILLALVIHIMDALGNYGSVEYNEWLNHMESWKSDSAAIVEPPCNFITSDHAKGKKRPFWALVDKVCVHNVWRSAQSSYYKYRTNNNIYPSEHLVLLLEDLLDLSVHNYETIRALAGRSLLRILKRWPSLISKSVAFFTGILQDPRSPEHAVLGACSVLSSQTILKHLATDSLSFFSFIMGILSSSHHESLKEQMAITELFVKYNINFSGISRNVFKSSDGDMGKLNFVDVLSQISSLSFETSSVHWRYNLMGNRVLLLLILSSRNEEFLSSSVLGETAGKFLRSLKSQLPHSRMLAVSALNALLHGASHKASNVTADHSGKNSIACNASSMEGILTKILQEEGFMSEALHSLANVHIISDSEFGSSKRRNGPSSFQSGTDKAITYFYFDFSASWPRTPSWISSLGGDNFYSSFARIFKRLAQDCGNQALDSFQVTLQEFLSAKERSKQIVAAEVIAGILHSDIKGLVEAWDDWIMPQLNQMLLTPSVESIPEWAACIRYAVTGKGKYGMHVPLLRQRILDCLSMPLPVSVASSLIAKRYSFLSIALLETCASTMSHMELQCHMKLLEELLQNMSHSSAQVREAIGVALSVVCSNVRLFLSSRSRLLPEEVGLDLGTIEALSDQYWVKILTEGAAEISLSIQNQPSNMTGSANDNASAHTEDRSDVKRMETIFHFIISSLKSGRYFYLFDIIVGLLYPVFSLQETSHKDLSLLAKSSFELLKWCILPRPFLEKAISLLLSSINDPNWRTRSASLSYIQAFMYRHIFTMSSPEKLQFWQCVEKLLVDNQVEVREHAAGVLASIMKGADEDQLRAFRERSYRDAQNIFHNRGKRIAVHNQSIATMHGTVLALAASVLSVPYDMPSWLPDHVTMLAQFNREPSPIKSTVTKAVAEFKRTHADTWSIQKDSFSDEQLEVLRDTSSSSSYFA